MMVKVTEPNSFIAWEFDVIIGEVLFCLLRAKSADATAATASASKVSIVLEPHNHREGESIQVSITTSDEWIIWLHHRVVSSALRPVLTTYNGPSLQPVQYLLGANPVTRQPSCIIRR